MLHSTSSLREYLFLVVGMERQVRSVDWGSSAAWRMGLKQEDGGGASGLMEPIGGGGGFGVVMAQDAGGVDDRAGMQHRVGVTGRRDGADGRRKKVAENTAEKKQKRMVKNRESAARSRARKQVTNDCIFRPCSWGSPEPPCFFFVRPLEIGR